MLLQLTAVLIKKNALCYLKQSLKYSSRLNSFSIQHPTPSSGLMCDGGGAMSKLAWGKPESVGWGSPGSQ